jgi:hypothetical protein
MFFIALSMKLSKNLLYTEISFYLCGITDFFPGENSPEGIETLCSHLEIPHTDVRILMLAWYVVSSLNFCGNLIFCPFYRIPNKCYLWSCIRKMGCEKQGYFTLVCSASLVFNQLRPVLCYSVLNTDKAYSCVTGWVANSIESSASWQYQ